MSILRDLTAAAAILTFFGVALVGAGLHADATEHATPVVVAGCLLIFEPCPLPPVCWVPPGCNDEGQD